jgi:acyl carrier protein
MASQCQICGAQLCPDLVEGTCQSCADLLRWFRGYFAHESLVDLNRITPLTSFVELGTDSLDYMDWLLEANEKLGIQISAKDAEKCVTVGEFLRSLRLLGAKWPKECEIRQIKKGGCFSQYAWVKVCNE